MRKRFIVLTAMACLFAGQVSAQWNKNATPVQIFDASSSESDYYGSSPEFRRTADGKTWMSYKIWKNDENGQSKVSTYLQLLDADGNKVFADPGILVNDHNTPTWWSYNGLAVTSDGCAVVTVADSRSEKFDSALGRYLAFQPAIYKIDQEGNFLWGLDGITYPEFQKAPFTDVYVMGDDIYFQFTEIEGAVPGAGTGPQSAAKLVGEQPSRVEEGAMGTFTMRYSLDGVPAWDDLKQFGGQMAPSVGSDFLLVGGGSNGAQVQRYNRDLEPVWNEPVTFDSYSCTAHDLHPYKIASDGNGGVAVAFVREMGQFSHNIRLQYINGDGELGFGLTGIDTYADEAYDHDYCGVALNPETKEIVVDWEDQLGTLYTTTVGKYNYYGDRLWGDYGIHLGEKQSQTGYAFQRIGCAPLPGGDWMVVYCDVQGWADMSIVFKRIDKDGNEVWKKNVGRSIDVVDPALFVESDCTYLFWRENSGSRTGINAVRIFNDGSFTTGIEEVTSETNAEPMEYYTVDGKKLASPQRGLNIVKYTDGSTRKVVLK